MRTNQHHGGLAARLGLALVAGLLLFTPATAQEQARRATDARPAAEARSDEEYELLIHRLELGMSALEELGRRDALEMMRRVTDQVRDQRAAAKRRGTDRPRERDSKIVVTRKTLSDRPREQDSEIEVVKKRLQVMRFAVEALVEAKKHDAAESVELAMHARKLSLEGRRDAEAQKIREKAPDRAQLAELLGYAARLHRKAGHPDRAQALAELSRVFGEQWRRRQQAARSRAERETDININSLEKRIEIVRVARAALAEANKRDGAEIMERFLHVAELQQSGADRATIAQAYQGTDKGRIIELLQGASKLYSESGHERKARACNALAEFYARHERPAPARVTDRAPVKKEPRSWNLEERADRVEILRYGQAALAKAGWETAAEQMSRMIQIGELQLAGETLEDVGELGRGLSMELVTEHLERASGMYREWGVGDRARLCAGLAKFYAKRDLGGEEDQEEARRAEVEEGRRLAERRAMEEQIQTFLRKQRSGRAEAEEHRVQVGRGDRAAVARDRMQDLTKRLESLEQKLKEVEAKLRSLSQGQQRGRR